MNKEEFDKLRRLAENLNKTISNPVKVCEKPCDQCLFSDKKIVTDERKDEILNTCSQDETHFICHKGSIIGQDIVCNGFYRKLTTPYLELMKQLGRIEFVDPMNLPPIEHDKSTQIKNNKRNKKKPPKGKRL